MGIGSQRKLQRHRMVIYNVMLSQTPGVMGELFYYFQLGDLENITSSLSSPVCKIRLMIVPACRILMGTQSEVACKMLRHCSLGYTHRTHLCGPQKPNTRTLAYVETPFVMVGN